MIVNEDGDKCWYLNDNRHREDGPAVERADGARFWYINGKKHRIDGPAEEWGNEFKFWYLNDERHREDGPAIEWANGSNLWYLNDKRLVRAEGFETMEAWFKHLNDNEEETYQLINDHSGFISFINNPSDRQKRLHQMRHVL